MLLSTLSPWPWGEWCGPLPGVTTERLLTTGHLPARAETGLSLEGQGPWAWAGRSPGQWPARDGAGAICVVLRPSLSLSEPTSLILLLGSGCSVLIGPQVMRNRASSAVGIPGGS